MQASHAGVPRNGWRWLLPFGAGVVLAAAASASAALVMGRPTPSSLPVARFGITLPADRQLAISFNDRDLALSLDGRLLVYTAGGAGNPTVVFNAPSLILDARLIGNTGRAYDVSSDGQRFLMLKDDAAAAAQGARPGIIVGQNWFEELKRRVPVQ